MRSRGAAAGGVFAALLLWVSSSTNAKAAPTGILSPTIVVDGQPADGACRYVARGPVTSVTSSTGGRLELPTGAYRLDVQCRVADEVLYAAVPNLEVKAHPPAEPRVDIETAWLRVVSRRSGVVLPARVLVFPSKATVRDTPLAELPANQRVRIASGRYRILAQLRAKSWPEGEVRFDDVSVAPGRTQVLTADFSDGGLEVRALANRRPTAATVRVFRPGRTKELGVVEAGQEIRLPAGRYEVRTELKDAADFATERREVWIRAGRVERTTEQFRTGRLTVGVSSDGRAVPATVRLLLDGASDFFNYFTAPGTVTLSPGRYRLAVVSEAVGPAEEMLFSGILVTAGGHTRKNIDLSLARLRVRTEKNGRAVDASVEVLRAGGGDPATPEEDGTFRLFPGRYEVIARLEDGSEVMDGPFEVALGQRVSRTLVFQRATLTVVVERGRRLDAQAAVLIFRPGAARPFVRARSGALIELAPGTYDIKAVGGPDTQWQQGVRVAKKQVVRIALPPRKSDGPAPPDGDLPPPGDEPPEGDATEEPAPAP